MKDQIINTCNNFLIADLDNDMVGMCKALVDFLKLLRSHIPEDEIPEILTPFNFYKLDPHLPRMEVRVNCREFLATTVKYSNYDEKDGIQKLKNLFVLVNTITYFYHMPSEKILELSKNAEIFTRDDSQKILLDDNMSPNWLKEPSCQDFSMCLI